MWDVDRFFPKFQANVLVIGPKHRSSPVVGPELSTLRLSCSFRGLADAPERRHGGAEGVPGGGIPACTGFERYFGGQTTRLRGAWGSCIF